MLGYDKLRVDVTGVWAEGHLYTALSRAKTIAGLSVIGYDKKLVITSEDSLNYHNCLFPNNCHESVRQPAYDFFAPKR